VHAAERVLDVLALRRMPAGGAGERVGVASAQPWHAERVTVVTLLAGLAALVLGAEALVRGASRIALGLGISPLVVGLTVVAIGTSSPELAVSLGAARAGEAAISLGNVVGSNVFNVLVVLGLSALITPLAVRRRVVQVEVPIMIALSVGVLLLGRDGSFGRADGLALALGLGGYLLVTVIAARVDRERGAGASPAPQRSRRTWIGALVLVPVGLALLVLGSQWLVSAAVALAGALGVGERVVGLTIVAAGTSLPELATSVVAAARGERDIAVGNVVGSNIFNIVGVLGLASIAAPTGVAAAPGLMHLDVPVMIAVAVLCLPVALSRARIDRWEGAVFLVLYAIYLLYLVLLPG
jgi:cation:H+ antiporter